MRLESDVLVYQPQLLLASLLAFFLGTGKWGNTCRGGERERTRQDTWSGTRRNMHVQVVQGFVHHPLGKFVKISVLA